MDTAPLTLFAQKVLASNRLLFADLRRLRRDVLPNGITTREEAELLLELDHIGRGNAEWPAYLAEVVAAFIPSASKPPDLALATTAWLITQLSAAQPRTAAAIVRTIERQGYQLNENLAVFTRRAGRALPSRRVGRRRLDCPSDSCSLPGE
jgi:hypothetical protein